MMSSTCCGKKEGSSPEHESANTSNHNGTSFQESVITQEMAFYCFDVLHNYLYNSQIPKPTFTDDAYPLFVTWKIGKDQNLRGCIGTFSPLNLHEGLREYAITSSMKDSRFSPIKADEVSRLHCAVSLLTNFQDCKNCYDWEVGKHGIKIEFLNEKGYHKTATYLPEVSQEQNWDQHETLRNLVRKAGYRGHVTQEFLAQVKTRRYCSEKVNVSYLDYARSRGLNGFASNHINRHPQHHPYMSRKNSKEKGTSLTNGYAKSPKQSSRSTVNHSNKGFYNNKP